MRAARGHRHRRAGGPRGGAHLQLPAARQAAVPAVDVEGHLDHRVPHLAEDVGARAHEHGAIREEPEEPAHRSTTIDGNPRTAAQVPRRYRCMRGDTDVPPRCRFRLLHPVPTALQ